LSYIDMTLFTPPLLLSLNIRSGSKASDNQKIFTTRYKTKF
jgi:hypothetical protein